MGGAPRDVLHVCERVALARAGESRGGVVLVLEEEIGGAVGIDKLLAPLLGGHVRNGLAGASAGASAEGSAAEEEGEDSPRVMPMGPRETPALSMSSPALPIGGIVGNVLRGGGGRGGLGLAQGHADGAEGEAHLLEELVRLAHEAGLSAGAAVLVAGGARRDGGRARRRGDPSCLSCSRLPRDETRSTTAPPRRGGRGIAPKRRRRRSPPRRNTRLPERANGGRVHAPFSSRSRRVDARAECIWTRSRFSGSPIHHDAAEFADLILRLCVCSQRIMRNSEVPRWKSPSPPSSTSSLS